MLDIEFVQAGRYEKETPETITKITYRGDVKPITFHTTRLYRPGTQLYRWQDSKWIAVTEYKSRPRRPYREFKVGGRDDFISLRPGESCTWTTHYEVLVDLKLGDRLRFVFPGAILDWWNWGSKQDQ